VPEAAAWPGAPLDSWGSRGRAVCRGRALSPTLSVGRNETVDGPDSMGRFSPISSQESLLTFAVDQCVNGAREARQ
jgi:hypothetical protein